jgi:hypothetical protein
LQGPHPWWAPFLSHTLQRRSSVGVGSGGGGGGGGAPHAWPHLVWKDTSQSKQTAWTPLFWHFSHDWARSALFALAPSVWTDLGGMGLVSVLSGRNKILPQGDLFFFVRCDTGQVTLTLECLSGISLSPLYKGVGHRGFDGKPRASPVISFSFSPITPRLSRRVAAP